MRFHPVVVIGAGLSGLTVAYRLLQKGVDVHVYEARSRVGGRVLSAILNDTIVELGAQNILDGGKAEHIRKLIAECGLTTTKGKIKSRFHYYDGTQLSRVDDVLPVECRSTQNLKGLANRSRNMAEVLQALFSSQPHLYNLFAIRLWGYEGLAVEELSSRYVESLESMMRRWDHVESDGHSYFEYMVLQEGNARLVEKLKEMLPDRIHLGLPLQSLSQTPTQSYRLTFKDSQVIEAERVILAIPCPVYKDIHFNVGNVFHSRVAHIKAVGYGKHGKIFVPVHRTEEFYGLYVNDHMAASSMATANIVTVFYINEALSFNPSTIQQVFAQDCPFLEIVYQDRSLSQLQAVYAGDEQFASYQGPVGYNWFNSPYSQGSYSCIAAGQEEAYTATTQYQGETVKELFSPIDDRLFFAGEHSSVLMDAIGTMEAAVEAGERTARMMTS